jgi:hypothetical protein
VADVVCGKCGTELDEPRDLPADNRQPCPACGSTARQFSVSVSLEAKTSVSVQTQVSRAFDPVSLTLLGVLLAVGLAVLFGVWAAVGSWPWAIMGAAGSLLILGTVCRVRVLRNPVVRFARWLVPPT